MSKKHKYAVLGGGGGFAIHTSKYLLEQDDTERVIAIGRNNPKPEPFSLNIGYGDRRYSYHTYHITYELDLMMELLDSERPDIVINYAAQGEGAASWKNCWRYFETNSLGLAKLTEELMKRDYLKRFIQIGTSELYGSVTEPVKENAPIKPSSPYAASKVAFDFHLIAISNVLKFPMNIIRPSNSYCPGQLLHRIIPRAILSGLKGEIVPLHGGGKARKSYFHARDLAKAIYLVVKKDVPLGKIYNVGPDEPISIRELVEKIAEVMEIPFDKLCKVTEERLGQDSCYWLDSSEIKKDTDWQMEVSLEEGLEDMLNWGKKYLPQLQNHSYEYVMRG
jgi:dTDP-glucose 4,6-dehydratase